MKRALLIFSLMSACLLLVAPAALAASTYAQTILSNPSLVSYWRLGEQGAQADADGTTAADATGTNPGAYRGGVNLGVPGALEGDSNTAAHFGTPDGYMSIPYASGLNTSAFTIEAWVNPDNTAHNMNIVQTGAQLPDSAGYLLDTYDDYGKTTLAFLISDGTTTHLLKSVDYTAGQWYYLAATYDGTTARLYANGQLMASVTSGYLPNSSYPTVVGESTVLSGYNQFKGTIDEVADYRAALSASTIQQHYELGITDGTPPATTLESAPPALTNQTTATFTFGSTSVGPTYQCQLDSGAWQTCSSPYQVTGLANGTHRLAVRAVSRAGLVDPSPPTATWTVDTVPPQTTFVQTPLVATNSPEATFVFGAAPRSTFTCQLDGGAAVPCFSPYVLSGLADGSHTLAVEATDSAGNVELSPAVYSWSIDTAAPSTFITQAPTAQDPTLPFEFAANEPGVQFSCQVDFGPWQACGSPFTNFPTTAGTHTLLLDAVDGLGNADPDTQSYSWTVQSDPVLPLHVSFPRQIVSQSGPVHGVRSRCGKNARCVTRGRSAKSPHVRWQTSMKGTLSVTVLNAHGQVIARVILSLPTPRGTAAVPASLIHKLAAGKRYTAVFQAKANGFDSAEIRTAFAVVK